MNKLATTPGQGRIIITAKNGVKRRHKSENTKRKKKGPASNLVERKDVYSPVILVNDDKRTDLDHTLSYTS
ncbi:hypothetical protein PILCRDRAFT_823854 [Piloderma croceum F 1598]|uniref:Uncharacterized protein n=1 Tax=Piloderma croceum (strain F 1598) TaxID=765440 RepID=A0A0C3BNT3_PILCF|nr:hypothetical protein PILCRDRAFT_823854 [Piloderma croceum F 1598]